MKSPIPRDSLGNEIAVGSLVTLVLNRPMIFRVEVVENGGIATAQGITPAVIRIAGDLTLRQMPGIPFGMMVKVVSPDQQKLVEDASDFLPRA